MFYNLVMDFGCLSEILIFSIFLRSKEFSSLFTSFQNPDTKLVRNDTIKTPVDSCYLNTLEQFQKDFDVGSFPDLSSPKQFPLTQIP